MSDSIHAVILECLAREGFMGLQTLELEVPGIVLNSMIHGRCDNTVTASYVNRKGGRVPELCFVAEALWEWLISRGSEIKLCEPEVPPTFPQALCERVAILFGDITQPLSS